MQESALQLALFVIEEGVKLEPKIAAAISAMFSKGIPTAEDWAALRASVASKDYRDYVPDTQLPPSAFGG